MVANRLQDECISLANTKPDHLPRLGLEWDFDIGYILNSQKVKDDLRKQKIELPESESDSVVTWENLLLPWIKLIPKSLIEVTFASEKKVILKQKLDRTDINIEGMDQRNVSG